MNSKGDEPSLPNAIALSGLDRVRCEAVASELSGPRTANPIQP